MKALTLLRDVSILQKSTLVVLIVTWIAKQGTRPNKSKSRLDSTVIRRTTAQNPKSTPVQSEGQTTGEPPRLQDLSLGPSSTAQVDTDDLTQIRALLRPPSIPGVEDFGIPPPSDDPVDAELAVRSWVMYRFMPNLTLDRPKYPNSLLSNNKGPTLTTF